MGNTCNISLSIKMSDDYKNNIMDLADEMAAAATEKNAHSYDNLIRARKMLEAKLEVALTTVHDI